MKHEPLREVAKKVLLLMAGPLRGGWGKAGPLRKKNFFPTFPTFQRPLSSKWGGGLGINCSAIKRRPFFCDFPKV